MARRQALITKIRTAELVQRWHAMSGRGGGGSGSGGQQQQQQQQQQHNDGDDDNDGMLKQCGSPGSQVDATLGCLKLLVYCTKDPNSPYAHADCQQIVWSGGISYVSARARAWVCVVMHVYVRARVCVRVWHDLFMIIVTTPIVHAHLNSYTTIITV
jgi:hypothetical protein